MPNLIHLTYDQTGKSKSTNALGMREMQGKAYEGRTAQYLLLKAPPASGKSRLFVAIKEICFGNNQFLARIPPLWRERIK